MKRLTMVLVILLAANTAVGQVTSNVFERVKRFRHGSLYGTAFTIEVEDHQYIITAKHNLTKLTDTVHFDLFLNGKWKSISAKAIYPSNTVVDIVALDAGTDVTPDFQLESTTKHLQIGQQVYFLGYPWGLATRGGLAHESAEIAFVKSGVLSAVDARQKDAIVLYVDGHNNPGFSGGPIVFREGGSGDFRVAGVIQGYRHDKTPVVKRADLNNRDAPAHDDLYVRANTGIVVGFGIKHIVDAIERERSMKQPAN